MGLRLVLEGQFSATYDGRDVVLTGQSQHVLAVLALFPGRSFTYAEMKRDWWFATSEAAKKAVGRMLKQLGDGGKRIRRSDIPGTGEQEASGEADMPEDERPGQEVAWSFERDDAVDQVIYPSALCDLYTGLRSLLEHTPCLLREQVVDALPRLNPELGGPSYVMGGRGTVVVGLPPAVPPSLVGREKERDELERVLTSRDTRVVAIVAPSGFGKTALLAKLIADASEPSGTSEVHVRGILFLRCECDDIDLGRIYQEAGQLTGRQTEFEAICSDASKTLERKLEYFLREVGSLGTVWLVMDSFERMLDLTHGTIANPEIRALLELAAGHRHGVRVILATQSLPRIVGHALSVVDLDKGLLEAEAVQYLREQGADVGTDMEDETVLREAARSVYCIPKGLESLLGYLGDLFPGITLAGLLRDPELFAGFRQRDKEVGLRHLIGCQLGVQSAEARAVLTALVVLDAPVPQAAVAHLLQWDAATTAQVFAQLVRSRLVTQNGHLYGLHALDREAIDERIPDGPHATHGELVSLRTVLHSRAADYYHALAERPTDSGSPMNMEYQRREVHHLVSAQRHANALEVLLSVGPQLLRAGSARLAVDLATTLIGHIGLSSMGVGNLLWISSAFDMLGEAEKGYEIATAGLNAAVTEGARDPSVRFLLRLAMTEMDGGRLQEAYDHLNRCEHLLAAEGVRDLELQGHVLAHLGQLQFRRGDLRHATICLRKALEASVEGRDTYNEAVRHGWLGRALFRSGRPSDAIAESTFGLDLASRHGYERVRAYRLLDLADYHAELRDDVAAGLTVATEGAELAREIGDRSALMKCLHALGQCRRVVGDLDGSTENLIEALSIATTDKRGYFEIHVRASLAELFRDLGRSDEGVGEARSAICLAAGAQDHVGELIGARTYARLLVDADQLHDALKQMDAAIERAEAVGDTVLLSDLLSEKAYALLRSEEPTRASEMAGQAMGFGFSCADQRGALVVGLCALGTGDIASARSNLSRVVGSCTARLRACGGLVEEAYRLAVAELGLGCGQASLADYHRALARCDAPGIVKRALKDLALLAAAVPHCPDLDRASELLSSHLQVG